ncbi:MAG TPA: GDSL-type esterase/lipase family protein [Myxococcales bacterium]|nr:GDSL-type esterase/lipase family protein [Myxococcales bacterium]
MLRYVALGDSSGVGVGAAGEGYPELLFQRLKAEGYPVGILNLSQSGATTREVVGGQVQKAASKSPHVVTLGVGANDLWKLVHVDTFRMNLKLIADHLERSGAEVIVSNISDLSLAPVAAVVEAFIRIPRAMFHARLLQLNEALGALARRPRFTVVDLFNLSRAELAGPTGAELFCPDGFHPSAKGYQRWAELLWPAVEAAAKRWRAAQPDA